MLTICWSAKGGSGVSVVAAMLALSRASAGDETLLVDLVGDLPAVLALAQPTAPGLGEWVAAPTAPPDALARLELHIAEGLSLLPRGCGSLLVRDRIDLLASLLASDARTVIVDCGVVPLSPGADEWSLIEVLAPRAARSLLVIRPCYLAMQRALRLPIRPTAAIVVDEDGRALDAGDIAQVLGVEVAGTIPVDPSIARAVDAGLLVARLPRGARRALRGVA